MADTLNAGTVVVALTAETAAFSRNIDTSMGKLEALSRTGAKVGSALTASITAPLAAIGALSVKAFAGFDAAMNESIAIMGDVSDTMRDDMAGTAREVSLQTTASAKEAADGYFYLASAGYDAAQSISALPQVAKFAQAGNFDLARATDLVTDAQSAMGLGSKDAQKNLENLTGVTDVLVKANTIANASVSQFSEALIEAAPSAKIANMSLNETTAVLAALADRGIKGAKAGTALAFTLPQLSGAALDNAGAWKELGLELFDAEGKMRDFPDFLDNVQSSLKGMSDEQTAAALKSLGLSGRMGKVILGLKDAGAQIRGYEHDLKSAGGITQEVADKQLASFANQVKLAKNEIVDLAIDVGAILAPSVSAVRGHIVTLVRWIKSWDDSSKKAAVAIAVTAAAVGPVILAVSGLAAVIPAVVAGFTAIVPAVLAAAPVFLAAAAAGFAVGVALNEVAESFGWFSSSADEAATSSKTFGESVMEWADAAKFAGSEIKFAIKSFMVYGQVAFENLAVWATNSANQFAAVMKFAFGGVGNWVKVAIAQASAFFENVGKKLSLFKDLVSGGMSFGEFTAGMKEAQFGISDVAEKLADISDFEMPEKIVAVSLEEAMSGLEAERDEAYASALADKLAAVEPKPVEPPAIVLPQINVDFDEDDAAKFGKDVAGAIGDNTEFNAPPPLDHIFPPVDEAHSAPSEPETPQGLVAAVAGSVEAYRVANGLIPANVAENEPPSGPTDKQRAEWEAFKNEPIESNAPAKLAIVPHSGGFEAMQGTKATAGDGAAKSNWEPKALIDAVGLLAMIEKKQLAATKKTTAAVDNLASKIEIGGVL